MEIKNHNKKYNHLGHLVYSCQYHIIFCPKYRRLVLTNSIDSRFKEIVKRRIPALWTHSMFISSVGAVTLEAVKKYIEEQKKV